MKRIFLLMFLVMMATYFLRGGADRWNHEEAETPGPRLVRDQKWQRQAFTDRREKADVADEDTTNPSNASAVASPIRKIESQLMATEERAKADAIGKLEGELTEWLSPEIPDTWKPPVNFVRSMIRDVKYTPVVKEYGTLYVAELTADTSAKRRENIIEVYRRETVQHRMLALGGTLAFVLACLGIISGYIRADEATKGYYTSRLRLLAAAGVGAAGMAAYRFI